MANAIFNLNSSRAELFKAVTTVITQLPDIAPNLTVVVGGKTLTVTEVVTELTGDLAVVTASETARQAAHDASVAEEQMRVALRDLGTAIKGGIAGAFGNPSTQAALLGFQRLPGPTVTAEEKAARAAKSAATRAARKTMGPRQKASIHGEPAATEPTAPEAPAVTAVKPGDKPAH